MFRSHKTMSWWPELYKSRGFWGPIEAARGVRRCLQCGSTVRYGEPSRPVAASLLHPRPNTCSWQWRRRLLARVTRTAPERCASCRTSTWGRAWSTSDTSNVLLHSGCSNAPGPVYCANSRANFDNLDDYRSLLSRGRQTSRSKDIG